MLACPRYCGRRLREGLLFPWPWRGVLIGWVSAGWMLGCRVRVRGAEPVPVRMRREEERRRAEGDVGPGRDRYSSPLHLVVGCALHYTTKRDQDHDYDRSPSSPHHHHDDHEKRRVGLDVQGSWPRHHDITTSRPLDGFAAFRSRLHDLPVAECCSPWSGGEAPSIAVVQGLARYVLRL